jgi:NAD+ diphosphatase
MFLELNYQDRDNASAYVVLLKDNKFLALENDGQLTLPNININKLMEKPIRRHYLYQVDGRSYYTAELPPDTIIPEGLTFYSLRRLVGQIPESMFFLIGKAYQIMYWDRTHQYCGSCGTMTEVKSDETAKICPSCGFISYPRISPAIIVAISRGKEILLARGSRFQSNFYSVLAGFVDPGETFEECVRREVAEEVGLKVKNIKYFGSQPWPFPDSLMVGFTAEYESGEIKIDKKEILDAAWFSPDRLPVIPGSGSIARQLIDWVIQNKG